MSRDLLRARRMEERFVHELVGPREAGLPDERGSGLDVVSRPA